jgi:hypothetical protein
VGGRVPFSVSGFAMNQYSTIPAFFSINFYAAIPGGAGILPASWKLNY